MSDTSITAVMPKVDLDQQALRLAGMADQIRDILSKNAPTAPPGAVAGSGSIGRQFTRLGGRSLGTRKIEISCWPWQTLVAWLTLLWN